MYPYEPVNSQPSSTNNTIPQATTSPPFFLLKGLSPAMFGFAIFCFLLPFLDMRCTVNNQIMTTVSGLDLVIGKSLESMEGNMGGMGGFEGNSKKSTEKLPPNLWAILAVFAAVLGLYLSFSDKLKHLNHLQVLAGGAGIIALTLLYLTLKSAIESKTQSQVTLAANAGYYLCCISFVLAAIIGLLKHSYYQTQANGGQWKMFASENGPVQPLVTPFPQNPPPYTVQQQSAQEPQTSGPKANQPGLGEIPPLSSAPSTNLPTFDFSTILAPRNMKIASLAACGMVILGFLLPWASSGNDSFNGVYLFFELLKVASEIYPLLFAAILAAIPVCGVLLAIERLKNGYSKLRFPTLYLSGIVLLPLLFISAKSALSGIPFVGMFMGIGNGIGITLMTLGSFYLLFDNVFHLAKPRTNMHTVQWLWRPAAIGAAIAVVPGIVILFSMKNELNAVLLFLCLALFIGGLVFTVKTHKANLGGNISLSRAVGAGSAATLCACLMTVILVPIIGSSFGKGSISAGGGFFTAIFMVVGVFGYVISNIIAFFKGWEPAGGYSAAKATDAPLSPSPHNGTPPFDSLPLLPTSPAVPAPPLTTPAFSQPSQTYPPPSAAMLPPVTVQETVPVYYPPPVQGQVPRTPSKPLSEQLQPLFDGVKKYRLWLLSSAGSLALVFAAYTLFLKPNPVKEGKKAAAMLCDCEKEAHRQDLKARRGFIDNFDKKKFADGSAAAAEAARLNEFSQEYLDCQQKANEKWAKLKSSYIGKDGLQAQLTMAYDQQLSILRAGTSFDHTSLDKQIQDKVNALQAMQVQSENLARMEESYENEENEMGGDPNTIYITSDNVNVRSEGSMSRGKVLFTLDKGASGEYVGERTDSRGEKWYQINFNGTTGWVSTKLVSADPDFEQNWKTATVNDPDGFTNLRDAPRSTAPIIGKVRENEEFQVLDQSGEWWLVQTARKERGYMHNSRIRFGNAVSQPASKEVEKPEKKTNSSSAAKPSKDLITDLGNGWKKFHGAWFGIEFPANFKAKPSMKSSTADKRYDSAFFESPDGTVTFYVFSPQWGGEAHEIAFNPKTEAILEDKTSKSKGKTIRWVKYGAKDNSYMRVYQETSGGGVNWTLGMKFKNWAAYERNKADYLKFKASLKQYAD